MMKAKRRSAGERGRNLKRLLALLFVVILLLSVVPTASATITYVVKQDGSEDYTTIQAAVNAVPADLVADGNSYIVEIQDSETYEEAVTISGKTTNATHTITLRAQAEENPTIKPPAYSNGITISNSYITVNGLRILSNRNHGIALNGGWNNAIYDNRFEKYSNRDSLYAIEIHGGGSNSIYRNIIDNFSGGIRIYRELGNQTVYNNLIYNTDGLPLNIRYPQTNYFYKIYSNTIYTDNTHALYLTKEWDKSSTTSFKNNIVWVRGADKYCIYKNFPEGGNYVFDSDYNQFHYTDGAKMAYRNEATPETDDTLSDWQTATSKDSNSNAGDPLFVSAGSDFHLQSTAGSYHGGAWTADTSTSPCIDAGNPSDSYSNEPEPNGDRVNMGAYGNTAEASKSPLVTSCNSAGDEINQFAPGEKVYVKAVELAASTSYKIWIQNYTVTEGATLQTNKDESGAQETVTTDTSGRFGYGAGPNPDPVEIWNISVTAAVTHHEHDIVVDKQDGGAGTYNAADDGLDSASVAGIVAPVPDVSSLVLFASGLVLVSVYFVYGRRRKGR